MTDKLPQAAANLAAQHPDVWQAHQALGKACSEAGPLDARTRRLLKLALSIGGGFRGAVHSHARQGIAVGIASEDLRQVAVLAIPTLGLARSTAALTWIDDIVDKPADG